MEDVAAAVTAPDAPVASRPFRFSTSLVLQEATGLRAATLTQLLKLLRQVPPSSVYYHTHHFLLQHHYLTEPTNDFAYWVSRILGEASLGESLASIDTMEYTDLEALRRAIIGAIESYLTIRSSARFRFVAEGEEFFFMKSIHVILPTPHTASTLLAFAQALERVSPNSLYFHMFDARLRLGRPTNDFSKWFAEQLGLQELADRVAQLDPYAYTLDTLRATLLMLIRQHLQLA